MTDKLLLLVPGLLVSLVSLYLAIDARRYSRGRDKAGDLQKRIDECVRDGLANITSRIIAIETKIEIFWKGVSYSAAQALHSPHTPALDELIEKFQRDQIDDAELSEFKKKLSEIENDEGETPFRRKAASEVLTLIRIRYEWAAA
jgi:hypothetical protein